MLSEETKGRYFLAEWDVLLCFANAVIDYFLSPDLTRELTRLLLALAATWLTVFAD